MFPSFLAWLSGSAFAVRLAIIVLALAAVVALGFAARGLAPAPLPATRAGVDLPLQLVPLVAAPAVHALLAR